MASGNVLLLGAGKCIEGKYKKVRVIGSGQIEGDITCEKLTSAGAAQVTGNIYFERCKVSGAFEVKGNLEGKCLRIMGAGEVGGKIRVETCRAYGAIEVKDNINAEYFIVRGAIECIGSINCEKIMVELLGKCVVEEIGASEIAIGQKVKIKEKSIKHKMINKMRMHIGKEEGDLRAQAVEGDKIYLDHAKVDTVSGGEIEIGPYCEIERLEYTKSVKIHESSKVKEQIQIITRRNR